MRKPIIPLSFLWTTFNNFIKCGTIGWCMEITFTAFGALRRRELPLMGQTSLWMFPIYGSAAFFRPVFACLRRYSLFFRGTVYALSIFGAEYVSGHLLEKHDLCPWNYNRHHWHINGLIRLDYFPFWFLAGILFEKLLTKSYTPSGLS
ncbi:MAG: putative ABC transporter permease [Lachnospiraceae bacterium]|nr:putative ABC transporter permease [Lachnospiraceae bacterium]